MKRPITFVLAAALGALILSACVHDGKVKTMKSEQPESPFGALEFLNWDHPWNSFKYPDDSSIEKIISLMKEAGVGCVRMDFLWEDIEPSPGEFKFERYDRIVELLCNNGIELLGLLNYSAPWASPTGEWNRPSPDNSAFVRYACKVIERYKGRIKYWEVWNEPDSPTYWVLQDGLKNYCALLKEVYAAAKKTNPQCVILNGGLSDGVSSVNHLYDNGAKGCFDILNIHIFELPSVPGAIKRAASYVKTAYKIMKRNGDGSKKIWITEIGCPGIRQGLQVKNWWMGSNPGEDEQSEWVTQVFTELIKEEAVGKVFWAFFRDTDKHWDNGIDYFGLVRWDYTRKPAFFAYRKCFENWKASQR